MSRLFRYLTALGSKVSSWKLICFFKCVLAWMFEISLPLCKDWISWASKLNSTFSIRCTLENCVNIHSTQFMFIELWYKIQFTEKLQFCLCCSAARLCCFINIALIFCCLQYNQNIKIMKSIRSFRNVSWSWW